MVSRYSPGVASVSPPVRASRWHGVNGRGDHRCGRAVDRSNDGGAGGGGGGLGWLDAVECLG